MATSELSLPPPAALSTVQTEETFSFQKYDTLKEDRTWYLGPHNSDQYIEYIHQYYSLQDIVAFFKQNPHFKDITLQFPDALVKDSSIVTQFLQENIVGDSVRIWVLADTAYSACCVDEVAAEHVKSDIVVHFGDACLNEISKLPVLYSFGNPFLDFKQVIESFTSSYKDLEAHICLMGDAPYTMHLPQLYDVLRAKYHYTNLAYAAINTNLINDKVTILNHEANAQGPSAIYTMDNRQILSDNSKIKDLKNYQLFHITVPQDPRLLYLTTTFQDVTLYDPKNAQVVAGPYPSLMKRYRFMHVARTAGCIGILINTLSLRNTKETINRLVKIIRSKGKKHYLFVVGKPNVAKLANFEPVDIWCILGCGQSGIILDQYNDFYKPIITPYELSLALQEEVSWTGEWIVDFQEALKDVKIEDDKEENDAPEFDAVTGKYVSTSRPLRNIEHLKIEGHHDTASNELVQKMTGSVVIKGTVSTSAIHLQNREWKGLGSDGFADCEEDGATVEEGIAGIARGYEFDRSTAAAKAKEPTNGKT